MAYVFPLTAVGDAVYALFQDAALYGLATGGIYSDVPESPDYPFVWIELLHQANYGGLGTRPGQGSVPGVTLRLHVFQSNYGTMRDAQAVMARAVELLFEVGSLVVDGYTVSTGLPMPEIETIPLADEELNGVKVKELVTNVDLIVQESASVSTGSWIEGGWIDA
jgi:hypothetical protein